MVVGCFFPAICPPNNKHFHNLYNSNHKKPRYVFFFVSNSEKFTLKSSKGFLISILSPSSLLLVRILENFLERKTPSNNFGALLSGSYIFKCFTRAPWYIEDGSHFTRNASLGWKIVEFSKILNDQSTGFLIGRPQYPWRGLWNVLRSGSGCNVS